MSTGRHLADSLALKIALVAVWLRCDQKQIAGVVVNVAAG
jgi:hypothetical protein